MFAYTSVLFLLIGLESFLLATRTDLDVTIVRARGTLFYTESDGRISNLYNVKVINKTKSDLPLDFIIVSGGAEIRLVGNENVVAKAGDYIDTQFFIVQPPEHIDHQTTKLEVEVWSQGKLITEEKTTFIGPSHKGQH